MILGKGQNHWSDLYELSDGWNTNTWGAYAVLYQRVGITRVYVVSATAANPRNVRKGLNERMAPAWQNMP